MRRCLKLGALELLKTHGFDALAEAVTVLLNTAMVAERDPVDNRPAAAHAWERLKAYLNRTSDGPDPAGDSHEHH